MIFSQGGGVSTPYQHPVAMYGTWGYPIYGPQLRDARGEAREDTTCGPFPMLEHSTDGTLDTYDFINV
jgi:hypothetical protein